MTIHYRNSVEPLLQATPVTGTAETTQEAPATRPLYRMVGKRILDVTLVMIAAVFVLPLIGLLALLVARDGGKSFYTQDRVGRQGRHYKIWKLRTMVTDAEAALEAHLAENPEARAEWNANQKLKTDPRITRFGRILRRTSLDELPQLWNVLKGDMSLVGPRPMMPSQRALYPGHAYFNLRPGITGSWQVSARNASTFADRAKFDTDYDRNISLVEDTKLLIATVRVVLKGTGY